MPHGILHRVVFVGLEPTLESAVCSILARRGVTSPLVCRDLASARAETYAFPGQPHLFLVQQSSRIDAAALSAFTAALPGHPMIVFLAPGIDLMGLLAIQRAGASQLVPLPLQEDDFLKAIDCIAMQFVPPPREGKLVAICGVSGGCGATVVALNLAAELSGPVGEPPRNHVLLVELARQVGTLAAYLGIDAELSVYDLLGDPGRLTTQGVRQALTHVAPGLDVIVGPYQNITPGSIPARHLYQLVEICRRLATVVILDVPCTFDDLQFETLALADQVVLVGLQSVPSVRTLNMVRDTLQREEGIRSLQLVINRYEPGLPNFSAEILASHLQVDRLHTIANDYPAVISSLNHGKLFRNGAPHSRVLADIRQLANALASPTTSPNERSGPMPLRPSQMPGTTPRRTIRVLYIEDDRVQQQATSLILSTIKDFKWEITAITNEAEALDRFSSVDFDLVLLDYHLAEGNGLNCLRALRKVDELIPIIVVSGVNEPHIVSELLVQADDYIGKENLSAERLTRAIKVAISRADGCKQRMATMQPVELQYQLKSAEPRRNAGLERLQKTLSGVDSELIRDLGEVYQADWPEPPNAAKIQRWAETVSSELGVKGNQAARRAVLSLFLRLFGTENDPK
jgi:pilus assembly protein CpaE